MERHFSALTEQRTASGLPIFALEHGLSETDLDEIACQLHARLAAGLRLAPHWLLWTIYAAEQGYTYAGGEYWQSFEEGTPGWDSSDRYRVTAWFRKFQKAYNGVVPSGPWAAHRSIIAWPITHAVLPRYLQQQFARTLYDLRFSLAGLNSIEPAVIGRLIAANVYYSTTRFEQFLQQEELVGRIVLGLLHQDLREGEETLLPATLDRIVVDLERMRHARGWLNEASRIVTERFKGIGRGGGRRPHTGGPDPGYKQIREQRPDIQPSLLLRYAGNGQWTLVIDIPSFRNIAALNTELREFLKKTRCVLNGSPEKKPSGWVLSGNRRAVLKNWPNPDKPLVEFEKNQGIVDHLLASECRMSDGPVWLFRIGSDGVAREITSRIVRPGYEYILASREPIDGLLEGMYTCAIDCSGIEAIRISVPIEVPAAYIHWLRDRNLELARTIRVWPAGLPGRNWDGEGRSEWLSTEKPCFGIVPDHPVDSYVVSLNNSSSTIIQAGATGHPTFIQLPHLEPGEHVLTIKARRSTALEGTGAAPAHEGYLELRVREPEPWIPGTASHAGLVVSSNPHDATLDAFWENEFDLTVFGPESRQVTPFVSLENAGGEEIYHAQVCTAMDLPITPDVWRKRFLDFLRRERCEWRYLEASSGVLKIDGQELGQYSLRFEHEAPPVRWVLRHAQDAVSIRLVDDTGRESARRKCWFLSMEAPGKSERLKPQDVFTGLQVKAPGGLFVARNGSFRDTVVVSTGLTSDGLEGLGVTPDFSSVGNDAATVIKLLKILRHWRRARLAGLLANARRRQVVDGLLIAVYGALAGAEWGRAEAAFKNGSGRSDSFDTLQNLLKFNHPSGFAIVLRRDAAGIAEDIKAVADWFSERALRFDVCSDEALSRFTLDLAVQPYKLTHIYRDDLLELLRRAKENPLLVRSARFVALLSANQDGTSVELLPSWST